MTALVQQLEFLRTVVIFLLLVNCALCWMLWFRSRDVVMPNKRAGG